MGSWVVDHRIIFGEGVVVRCAAVVGSRLMEDFGRDALEACNQFRDNWQVRWLIDVLVDWRLETLKNQHDESNQESRLPTEAATIRVSSFDWYLLSSWLWFDFSLRPSSFIPCPLLFFNWRKKDREQKTLFDSLQEEYLALADTLDLFVVVVVVVFLFILLFSCSPVSLRSII